MVNYSRRNFLSWAGAVGGTLALAPTLKVDASDVFSGKSSDSSVSSSDNAFWTRIRSGFDLPHGIVNLDNGYCNPLSRETMADLLRRTQYIQQLPGKRLVEVFEDVTYKHVRPGLSRLLGVPGDEIAFTRNTTESMDTVILGFPMKAGDEVVCCSTDYYAMLDAIEQRRQRDGIVVR